MESGDTNGDSKLDLIEEWVFKATGTATAGQYHNTGTARGFTSAGVSISASDDSWYYGTTGPGPEPGPEVGGNIYPPNRLLIITPLILTAVAFAIVMTVALKRRHNQN